MPEDASQGSPALAPPQPPLRLAVLVDGVRVPRWIHQAIERVTESKTALLECVAVPAGALPPRRSWRPGAALLALYERADRRAFASARDPLAPVDASPLFAGVARRVLRVARCGASYAIAEDDVRALEALRLDVILKLGFPPLRGAVLSAARYGVWAFEHAEAVARGESPFFRQIAGGEALTETALLRLGVDGAPDATLYRSFGATDRMSLQRSRSAALAKSAAFVERCFARLVAEGEPAARPVPSEAAPRAAGRVTLPEVVRFGTGLAGRVVRSRLRSRRYEEPWFVAVRRARPGAPEPGGLDGFEELVAPPDRFWADPFLVRHGDAHYLFFEDASLDTWKGRLCALEIFPDGRRSEPWVVLEHESHLSYPFVFSWHGEHWLLPETGERRTVELHRAVEFPFRWELERVLLRDVVAADPTLLERDGRFWLFLAMSPTGAPANEELFLFHADSPLGDWHAHPLNPVVSDVRRARPAGRLFERDGVLIRPGQDCSAAYGGALTLSRVDVLEPWTYRETPIARIAPDWLPGLTATHTWAAAGDFEAIDGRRYRRRAR